MKSTQKLLYDNLKSVSDKVKVPFYMPGHKMSGACGQNTSVDISFDVFNVDFTEICGTDNLHRPSGIIRRAEERASDVYGASRSYFLINGSTCGNHAAIMAHVGIGDKILIAGDSHKSIYTGAVLSGAEVEIISPVMSEDGFVSKGIDVKDVEMRLMRDESIKMVVAVYPTYYGHCFNIRDLADTVSSHDALLLVDSAHGAHLKWMEGIPNAPECPVKSGADIVVQSMHKTLPSLTQTAILHVSHRSVKGKPAPIEVDIEKLEYYLGEFQSSSPSYPFMVSIDNAISFMNLNGNDLMRELYRNINEFKNRMKNLNIRFYDESVVNGDGVYDFTKIAVSPDRFSESGFALGKKLRDDYGIYAEIESRNAVLFYASVLNGKNHFDALADALGDISANVERCEFTRIAIPDAFENRIMKTRMRNAVLAGRGKTVFVELSSCAGKISAGFVTPYPPGIPVLVPGQLVSREIVCAIDRFILSKVDISGIFIKEKSVFIKVLI